ncbi:hypothetical protein XF14_29800 [Burkholderia gladioli]|nr:hypothetical protein XF14_29800 [Burkholderia gladioli]
MAGSAWAAPPLPASFAEPAAPAGGASVVDFEGSASSASATRGTPSREAMATALAQARRGAVRGARGKTEW